jgi:hypothetical protein
MCGGNWPKFYLNDECLTLKIDKTDEQNMCFAPENYGVAKTIQI